MRTTSQNDLISKIYQAEGDGPVMVVIFDVEFPSASATSKDSYGMLWQWPTLLSNCIKKRMGSNSCDCVVEL